MSEWQKDNFVGFFDEAGDMREREVHVIAGLVFPRRFLRQSKQLSKQLMDMTPPCPRRLDQGKPAWPKAYMLPQAGLDLFAEGMKDTGCTFANVKKSCDTETREQAGEYLARTADRFLRPLQAMLRLEDRLDIRVGTAIQQYESEARRHPFYFQLVHTLLKELAESFQARKLVPLCEICFDLKFQKTSLRMLNLLLRGQFYTSFADAGGLGLAQVFGLTPCGDFVARFGEDPEVECLYLADIYAHACGRVVKERDPDGTYKRFLESLGGKAPQPFA